MKKFLTLEQMTVLRNFGIDVAPKDTGMIYSAVGGEYKLVYADTDDSRLTPCHENAPDIFKNFPFWVLKQKK